MKQTVRPSVGPTASADVPPVTASSAGMSLDAARLREASDQAGGQLLDTVRLRLREIRAFVAAEDVPKETDAAWAKQASHAPHGAARLPSTARWGPVAEAYREVAASVARGDLVQAASRLREAERLDAQTRRRAPWALPELPADSGPRVVPRAFATPQDIPPDISALADQIALREGAVPRPGVLEDLDPRAPRAATDEADDELD